MPMLEVVSSLAVVRPDTGPTRPCTTPPGARSRRPRWTLLGCVGCLDVGLLDRTDGRHVVMITRGPAAESARDLLAKDTPRRETGVTVALILQWQSRCGMPTACCRTRIAPGDGSHCASCSQQVCGSYVQTWPMRVTDQGRYTSMQNRRPCCCSRWNSISQYCSGGV